MPDSAPEVEDSGRVVGSTSARAWARALLVSWCALPSVEGQDVDQLAPVAGPELHHAVAGGEERVVAALADVQSGMEPRAPLADEDRSGRHDGAVERLHAEALGFGVTAVPGGTAALGLRHGELPLL